MSVASYSSCLPELGLMGSYVGNICACNYVSGWWEPSCRDSTSS